ncbi:DUF6101 family protein [Bartonella quintana]|uniref:Uncharacterized protein n=3 Tax=Bartonella quintana TaxID=803 RepID=A0A0H3LTN0_BARQU|nr:DUF6101 family protein [Bartonella quintana]AFR26071.1 hypothetical protein RM11_0331 [Bartonella quintana RM-11]ETS11765.1 hypothetical protein Q651_01293 [Bartonella quintana BQ2-D70]ETS14568.1 hypothetical protein Q650_01209 [Bartonella quintana JK 73rel]ETS16255.1 hypothetical protein Q649_01218 [Bartonella quintana JK 73]ETS18258.1 hypothetical protein Q647_01207 [Bartonella quintana JK 7]
MANQCFNQAKAVLEFRLDPCHLPQTTTYFSSKTGNQIICSLSERGVFFKTDTSSSLSRLVPSYHFKGIAACTVKTRSGERAVALELLHADEEACIPLLVSRDLNNVLLDWRLWADTYNLPMLMINEDNRVIVVKDRSDLRQFFYATLHSKQKHFLLRYSNPLGLRLIIANRIAL